MPPSIASPVVDATGKTRLRASLERAKRGEGPSVGQWLELPGYSLARTVAPLGEDWVLIDAEHGNIDDRDMYLQVGAVSTSGVSPIVRIPASESWMIKRALDCGAHAIMVPMCETKEQAEMIVRACKYPSERWPQGIRGAGAMYAPAAFNQNGREYLLSANDNVMICVQIESRKAVENVEEIAAVDGIDMLFIGPNDLASSMGYVAFDHASTPEVQTAIARVLQAGLNADKYVGHFALSAEAAAVRVGQGFHFVNCGADIVAVTAWMTGEMDRLKKLLAPTNGHGAVNGKGEKKVNGGGHVVENGGGNDAKVDIGYSVLEPLFLGMNMADAEMQKSRRVIRPDIPGSQFVEGQEECYPAIQGCPSPSRMGTRAVHV